VQTIDEIPNVIGNVAKMKVFSPPVAWIENLLEILAGGHMIDS
jgi:hypothetical protein